MKCGDGLALTSPRNYSCILDPPSGWLYDLCRGIDKEPVKTRTLPQSIGCGKNFVGPAKLKTAQKVGASVETVSATYLTVLSLAVSCPQVLYWLEQLVEEVRERLAHDQKQVSTGSIPSTLDSFGEVLVFAL